MRAVRYAAVFAVCAACLSGATETPSITPQVSSIFPHGGRRGTEVAVEFRGSYLDGARELIFPGQQLEGTIVSSGFRGVRAKIRIAGDAETGRHDFRLVTPRGAYFGVFYAGPLEESSEAEPNDEPERAQILTLPALVNGRADGADADYYRVHAEAGQTIVFDVAAGRLGSALDPVLTLFDARGREIDYCDDADTFKDARLAHTFAKAGDYTVLVSASFERSARDAEYRLAATSGPYAASVLPAGSRRGAGVDLLIRGWNLDRVDRVWLGRGLAEGRIVGRSATEVRARLEVPAGIAAGSYQLYLGAGSIESPAPLRFEIGDLPEVTVAPETPATELHPFRTRTPAVVNGEIPNRDGNRLHRVQYIEFEAREGGRYEFRVDAWKLGMRIDPVLTLYDADGKVLAQEDDPAPNSFIHHPASHDPCLVYVFPRPGLYRLQVRDAAYEGGPGTGYRLTIRETEPSFELDVRSPQITVFAGGSARLLGVVRRTGGVHIVEGFRKPDSEIEHFRILEKDGWNTPVRVSADGLPPDVTADAAETEPKNTTFKGNDGEELFVEGTLVEIPFRAAAGAKPGLYEIALRARGRFAGREVERRGVVLYTGPRAMRGQPARDQKLFLNVIAAPPLLWIPPGEFRLSKGASGKMKVGLFRREGSFPVEVSPKSLVTGWNVGSSAAAPGAEEIEVPVTAMGEAKDAPAELVLVATFQIGGREIKVESPPIELRIKP